MKSLVKSIISVVSGVLFGMFMATLLILHPEPQTPHNYETVSKHYDINQKQAIRRSVNSSVRVVSVDLAKGNISTLSGTYFTFRDKFYVLSSAHGIFNNCSGLLAFHDQQSVPCIKVIILDKDTDYVIFEVEELKNRIPIKVPRALANWKKSYNLLDKIYYTGYPNSIGPTTWTGNISGFTGDYLVVQSYAWSGASGAGVFDERGELIGIIMALDVGATEFGYQVLSSFVIVVPVWQMNFSSLME